MRIPGLRKSWATGILLAVSHFLQYWKLYNREAEFGTPLHFSASSQYHRRKVAPGDTFWLVALLQGRLTLLGSLVVDDLLDRDQALERLGDKIYRATTYIVSRADSESSITEIDIQGIAQNLRFEGGVDRLPRSKAGKTDGKSLQSIRLLTSESAALLQQKLGHSRMSRDVNGSSRTILVDNLQTVLTALGGIASLNEIYEGVREFREDLTEPDIRRTIQQHSSDSIVFEGRKDIFYSVDGIGEGVWGLRSMLAKSPHASDLNQYEVGEGLKLPVRVRTETYRIIRDSVLTRKLKQLYAHRCQICGFSIALANETLYSEAHHIRPLGGEHKGSDHAANVLVLCPNHHAMLDIGAIRLDSGNLNVHSKHKISMQSINYHNRSIFNKHSD